MPAIFENILIMIATVVVLLCGGYLLLVILGWGLKLKSGHREQQGLADLWIASQVDQSGQDPAEEKSRDSQ
jgi:hypothetical protein